MGRAYCRRNEDDVYFESPADRSTCEGIASRQRQESTHRHLPGEDKRQLRQGQKHGRRGRVRVRPFTATESRITSSNPTVATAPAYTSRNATRIDEASPRIPCFRTTRRRTRRPAGVRRSISGNTRQYGKSRRG